MSEMTVTLKMKIGSIIVHADELTSASGNIHFDGPAIRALVQDPEVIEFLDAMPDGLLPLKRGHK